MKFNKEKINKKLETLSGWIFSDNSILKTYEFENFLESIDFVNKIVPVAERVNHHPDIKISYNKVTITLSTHDEGGITEKDINLAQKIETL